MTARHLALALSLVAGLMLACDSSTPTAPSGGAYTVDTVVGPVTVRGGDPADAGRVAAEVAEGARRIAVQGFDPTMLSGFEVYVRPGVCTISGSRTVLVPPGGLGCTDHEMQHLAAKALGRSGECVRCADHKGRLSGDPDAANDTCDLGYLLDCSPYRRL